MPYARKTKPNQRIKLDKQLSQHNTKHAKLGVGITRGNDTPSTTEDGDKVKGGRFTVLWYERRVDKSTRKQEKYLKRRTIKLDGNRDQAETNQIIEGISRVAGHLLDR